MTMPIEIKQGIETHTTFYIKKKHMQSKLDTNRY